jgi:hypothetical protein
MSKSVKQVLRTILGCFESGDVPRAIAYSIFPIPDLPSSKWSLMNRMFMFLSGTADARGYGQWKKVDRYVKRGAKAIYILVPRIVKRKIEGCENEQEEQVIAGFMARPVFRVEDTEGEPLDYQHIGLPELPLIDKAKEWGVSVKAIPGNYHYFGYFSQKTMEIALATKEETVFFHELAHAAHQLAIKDFRETECWKKEIVAELAAAVLCKMVGKTSKYLGNSYTYIKRYAEKESLSPVRACLRVIGDVEKVLDLILQNTDNNSSGGPEIEK